MFVSFIFTATAMFSMLANTIVGSPTDDISPAIPTAKIDDLFAAWGQFCNDLTCDDCGTWVDLSNSNCLSGETGRQSVNIKSNGPEAFVALVYTPDNECSCQSECESISGTGCWQLNTTLSAETQSYRFVNFGDYGKVCGNTNTNC